MKYLLSIFSICFLFSCNNIEDPEIKQLNDKVMEIHDEVMPKMSMLHRLGKKIKKLSPEELSAKSEIGDAEVIKKQLEDASEGMMAWMAEYKIPEGSKEVQKSYLDVEMLKINKVKSDMLVAISNAENYLK